MHREIAHLKPGHPAQLGQSILERRWRILNRTAVDFADCKTILDAGCGNGAQSGLLLKDNRLVVGVDLALPTDMLSLNKNGFRYVRGDLAFLPLQEAVCDLAVSFELLEHTLDDLAVLREIARVVRPGGGIFFSVPNKWWLFESHGAIVPGLNFIPWNRIPFVSWLPRKLHSKIAQARIYTLRQALNLTISANLQPLRWGYITAPLDVLPDSLLRKLLKTVMFRSDITSVPILAVNLFVYAVKTK